LLIQRFKITNPCFQKVFVDGRFKVESYVTKDGETRQSLEVTVDKYGVVPPKVVEPVTAPVTISDEDPIGDFPF
jgi:single-stranded DNA-binding protein